MDKYWRNRDGSIVHTNDCIYSRSRGSAPWNWAQGISQIEVRRRVDRVPWLHLCGKCWPKETDDDS